MRLRGRLLVGADGLGSTVGDRSAPRSRRGRKIGFSLDVAHAPGARPEPGAIDMLVLRGGYVGAVRSGPDRLHVAGLLDTTRGGRHPAELLRDASAALGIDPDAPRSARWFGAAPMPWRPAAVAGPRSALVGDAAGYVEPFTGEGLSWAFESARLLAEAVAEAPPGTWSGRAAARYRRAWRRSIGARQRTCRWIAAALERPGLFTLLPEGARRVLVRELAARVMAA
jgi:flavin-dependent dehydrogenase